MLPVDEFLPVMFDKHPIPEYRRQFPRRDLAAFSVEPLLVFPTHYTGDAGYVSDTETSVLWDDEATPTDWDRARARGGAPGRGRGRGHGGAGGHGHGHGGAPGHGCGHGGAAGRALTPPLPPQILKADVYFWSVRFISWGGGAFRGVDLLGLFWGFISFQVHFLGFILGSCLGVHFLGCILYIGVHSLGFILGSFLGVYYFWGSFLGVHFISWGSFWAHFLRFISWVYFRFISWRSFQVHFGFISGSFWVHFRSISGPFRVCFGFVLGSFWVHFRFISGGLLGFISWRSFLAPPHTGPHWGGTLVVTTP
ncbi:hypothetical protein Q9966_016504, partial [Columba livia]